MAKPSTQATFGIRMAKTVTREERRRYYAEFWTQMKPYVATVVMASFASDEGGMRNPTMAEVKSRVDSCKDLVDELRNDMQWSSQRIRDHLGIVLRARLAGIELPLEKMAARASW